MTATRTMRSPVALAWLALALSAMACSSGGDAPEPPRDLAYSESAAVYMEGIEIPPNVPASSGGAVTAWAVSPALPAGLALSPASGVISGTPAAIAATASYTVTASNPGGSTSASISITVVAQPVSGLDGRPPNGTCVAPPRPTGGDTVTTVRVFPGLAFSQPVALLQAPADPSRWFVVELAGTIRVFDNRPDVTAAGLFVTVPGVVSGGELGLLGMAFHPGFPADPRVYLSYTTTVDGPLQSHLAEFRSGDGGQTLDAASRRVLLRVNQPFTNHNGGNVAFGPDGHLYLGLGDGGSGGDPLDLGQNLTTLLGKFLRIDVDGGTPYGIPGDLVGGNPFAGNPLCDATGSGAKPCPEIFAWGFRNPWRWSFDGQTGQLWAGDVGQGIWEEIDVVLLGGNYGWRLREGAHCYDPPVGCPTAGLVDPVSEYDHYLGQSVTGGFVYRGSAIPSLAGRYLFGDFVSGRLWIADPQGSRVPVLVAETNHLISSFGQGLDGELYVVDFGGTLHAVRGGTGPGAGAVPASLADTGCVDPLDPTRPAPGLIPYAPNAELWSDGAAKERWIALPDGLRIDTSDPGGDWDLPGGTVLVKAFRLGARLVETRLLMRHPDGVWAGYTYEWNDAQTAATLISGGKTRQVAGQTWSYPSEAQCLACHTVGAGRSLSLETAQLNRRFRYPQTGRTANQVATLDAIDTLAPRITADPATLPAYPDPAGTQGTPASRARAYLHANCSHCHRPNGSTPVPMDLRYATPLAETGACNALPQAGDLGLGAGARLVVPGDPDGSILVARMGRRDAAGMPPIGSSVVDAAGVTLVRQWIAGLPGCD